MTLPAGIVGKSTGSISIAIFPPLASYAGGRSMQLLVQESGTGPLFPALAAYSGASAFAPTIESSGLGTITVPLASYAGAVALSPGLVGDGPITPPLAAYSGASAFAPTLAGIGTITPPLASYSGGSGVSPTLEGLGTITASLTAYSGASGFSPTIEDATFEPDTSIANMELWLDASDSGTITESSGEVSQWDDKGPDGNDVSQGTAANQPNTSTVNTNDGLFFDGTGELLRNSSVSINTAPLTYAIVLTPTALGSGFFFPFRLRDGTTGRFGFTRDTSTLTSFADAVSGTDLTLSPSSNLSNGSSIWAIARHRDSGGGSSDYVDSDDNTASGTGPTTSEDVCDDINIGSNANGANSFAGHIHEIIVYNRFISDTERDDLADYLNNKWSV